MVKIWSGSFWGGEDPSREEPLLRLMARTAVRPALAVPTLVLAVPSVVLGIAAQPLLTAATEAAAGLLDASAYVRAVTR
ncbi:hypothetical protein [Streptomyces radiopugnans]|uniref:Multicomponent Na+:H+ antiporter subunit D n=1 Tax=Streptomyces radiopugnans TaxID=403935 RepID=A0A1H9F497_9ACTN|nr:hypothetical protein [Streptomyces radiopugnans]SEQ32721.1 multicomponent Na+:H+ antiporter subunit D [Streptomyces radiopugnans]